MKEELVTVFLSHKLGKLIEDISSKKITTQEHLDLVWHKVFDKAIEIEKKQIINAYIDCHNEGHIYGLDAEKYYNETYLEEIDNENT